MLTSSLKLSELAKRYLRKYSTTHLTCKTASWLNHTEEAPAKETKRTRMYYGTPKALKTKLN